MLHINKKSIHYLRTILDEINYAIIIANISKKDLRHFDERAKLVVLLFHLHEKVSIKSMQKEFGRKHVANFLSMNLLKEKNSHANSNYKIYSYNNYYFLSGYLDDTKEEYGYLANDSLIFAKFLPLNFSAKNILDLCTGPGMHAILLSKNAKKVTGVEISKEVVNVARFNTVLNRVNDTVAILQGDLFAPLSNHKFDVIVSNPPYIPVPDAVNYPVFGRGGEDGLLVLKRIINEIGDYLTKTGIGLILGITFGDNKNPFIIDLLTVIAKRDSLDIDIFLLHRIPKNEEIINRGNLLKKYNPKSKINMFSEMRNLYRKMRATYLYVYLIRLKKGKGNLKVAPLYH